MQYPKPFNTYIDLPIDACLDLEDRLVHKKIGKKEFLFREGQVVNYLPFINDGIMINYIVAEDGEKHVIQIRGTGLWLGDLYSFFPGVATRLRELLIHRVFKNELAPKSPEWVTLSKCHPLFSLLAPEKRGPR